MFHFHEEPEASDNEKVRSGIARRRPGHATVALVLLNPESTVRCVARGKAWHPGLMEHTTAKKIQPPAKELHSGLVRAGTPFGEAFSVVPSCVSCLLRCELYCFSDILSISFFSQLSVFSQKLNLRSEKDEGSSVSSVRSLREEMSSFICLKQTRSQTKGIYTTGGNK